MTGVQTCALPIYGGLATGVLNAGLDLPEAVLTAGGEDDMPAIGGECFCGDPASGGVVPGLGAGAEAPATGGSREGGAPPGLTAFAHHVDVAA